MSVASFVPLHAQRSGMPLFLVEGNRYERRSFDADGTLEEVETLEIGQLSQLAEELEITVVSRSFLPSGEATDSVRTTIRCQPEGANMVMNLFALIKPEGRSVRLRFEGGEINYPTTPTPTSLPDISLEARVEEGVVGFLGGRSQIVISNRTLTDDIAGGAGNSELQDAYSITSRIEMKSYVLGIRMRSRSYESIETVSPDRGLIRQRLTADDGSTTSLELVS